MTRNEILAQYKIVATRCARKGELVLATKNHGGECAVIEQTGNNKRIVSEILEEKHIDEILDADEIAARDLIAFHNECGSIVCENNDPADLVAEMADLF